MLRKKREVGVAIGALLLVSCSTMENIKTEVMERLPKKQTAQVSEGDTTAQAAGAETPLTTQQQLVVKIQESLKKLGYSTGAVNGRLGARTEAAIQDFQLDNGLRIDGKPTQKLLDLIEEKAVSK